MATLEERFSRGIEVRTRIGGGTLASSVPVTNEMAPDLHRIAAEALFGSIWSRPALDVERREMCTLSVLAALERENQLKAHVGGSLNQGLTPEQVIEVFVHLGLYIGVPASFNAMALAREVFDARGIRHDGLRVHDGTQDPDALYQHGLDRRRELMGDLGLDGDFLTAAEEAFRRLEVEYLWGSVWGRPVLDEERRFVCALAALAGLGQERQLAAHIRGAIRSGLSREQVVEVLVHSAFYAGFPAAGAAIDVANEVFRTL